MAPQLRHSAILAENVYNMDETGVLLGVLAPLKIPVEQTPRCSRQADHDHRRGMHIGRR